MGFIIILSQPSSIKYLPTATSSPLLILTTASGKNDYNRHEQQEKGSEKDGNNNKAKAGLTDGPPCKTAPAQPTSQAGTQSLQRDVKCPGIDCTRYRDEAARIFGALARQALQRALAQRLERRRQQPVFSFVFSQRQ